VFDDLFQPMHLVLLLLLFLLVMAGVVGGVGLLIASILKKGSRKPSLPPDPGQTAPK
jgi:hypothetical protein